MFINTQCPVCNATAFSNKLVCKDYTVSQESFTIVACDSCHFHFTNPRPEDEKLGGYYKSEDYISHSNTTKGIVSKLYHLVRNFTLKKKVQLISKYVSRGTVLDYGCGTGMFLNACKNSGLNVLGMEPDADARKIAAGMGIKAAGDKAAINELSAEPLDVITLWHVLEHVNDLDETLSLFKNKLAKNGILVIAVPNHLSYDAQYYKEFWAAYDVPRHLYHFDRSSVQLLLNKFGFKLVETKPMKFDSFYVSMLSEKYRAGAINYFKAFLTGLTSNSKATVSGNYSSLIYIFKHS